MWVLVFPILIETFRFGFGLDLGILLLSTDLDGKASENEEACQGDYGWLVGAERALAESEEQELEVCEPSEEEGGDACEMHRGNAERKEEEEEDSGKHTEKPCEALWDCFAEPIAIAQGYQHCEPYNAQVHHLTHALLIYYIV